VPEMIRQGYRFSDTASITIKLFQRYSNWREATVTLSDGDKTVDTNLVEYAHVLGATLEEVAELYDLDKHTWAQAVYYDDIVYPAVAVAEIKEEGKETKNENGNRINQNRQHENGNRINQSLQHAARLCRNWKRYRQGQAEGG